MWIKGKTALSNTHFLKNTHVCVNLPADSLCEVHEVGELLANADLRANLEVILPMREVEVPRVGEAAACCDRLGEAGGPL